jgi:hypothetical protein
MDIFELSPENQENVLKSLRYFYKNDDNALKLAVQLLFIGHLWDDLVDGDKQRNEREINDAFTVALGEIPLNPYFPAIYHMMRNAMIQWECSNILAHGHDDNKFTGFLIRNSLMEVVHYLIFLVGGQDWAREQGPKFWQLISGNMQEKYWDYLREFEDA